jgi:hypothetical protein
MIMVEIKGVFLSTLVKKVVVMLWLNRLSLKLPVSSLTAFSIFPAELLKAL